MNPPSAQIQRSGLIQSGANPKGLDPRGYFDYRDYAVGAGVSGLSREDLGVLRRLVHEFQRRNNTYPAFVVLPDQYFQDGGGGLSVPSYPHVPGTDVRAMRRTAYEELRHLLKRTGAVRMLSTPDVTDWTTSSGTFGPSAMTAHVSAADVLAASVIVPTELDGKLVRPGEKETCSKCSGSGVIEDDCETCLGEGEVFDNTFGYVPCGALGCEEGMVSSECSECAGDGEVEHDPTKIDRRKVDEAMEEALSRASTVNL